MFCACLSSIFSPIPRMILFVPWNQNNINHPPCFINKPPGDVLSWWVCSRSRSRSSSRSSSGSAFLNLASYLFLQCSISIKLRISISMWLRRDFGSRFRFDDLWTDMTNFEAICLRNHIRRVRSFWWWSVRVCVHVFGAQSLWKLLTLVTQNFEKCWQNFVLKNKCFSYFLQITTKFNFWIKKYPKLLTKNSKFAQKHRFASFLHFHELANFDFFDKFKKFMLNFLSTKKSQIWSKSSPKSLKFRPKSLICIEIKQ